MFKKKNSKMTLEGNAYQGQGKIKEIWRRLKKNRGAMIGLLMLCIMGVVLLIVPLFVSYESAVTQDFSQMLAKPTKEHIFGNGWLWERYFC